MKMTDKDKIIGYLKSHISEDVLDEMIWSVTDESGLYYQNLVIMECDFYNYKIGASKIVLFDDVFSDFVIKIPFCGEAETKQDEYAEEHIVEKTKKWFHSAYSCTHDWTDDNEAWDYCLLEAKNFNMALNNHFDDFFAETALIGNLYGHPIYAAHKANQLKDTYVYKSSSKKSVMKSEKMQSKYGALGFSVDALTELIETNGEKRINELVKFLAANDICDLNNRNLGKDESGKIKIIDYSNFYDYD